MFSAQQSELISALLNAALAAISDAPDVDRTDRTTLQLQLEQAIHYGGYDDLLSIASLDVTLGRVLKSRAFRSVKEVEVVLLGFGGGLVATTASPRMLITPERQTV